jgi:hypothetical protein
MTVRGTLFASLAALAAAGIASADGAAIRFEDATAASGIGLTLTSGRMPSTATCSFPMERRSRTRSTARARGSTRTSAACASGT